MDHAPLCRRRGAGFHASSSSITTVPLEVRAARLAARGRESAEEVKARLARAPDVPLAADLEIENTGPVAEGAARLAAFLRRISADAAAA